ncbi:uncharacterized protein RJT21DRAFT_114581 [Scheffersomyces amazonensis]|uniref:uncharacterized protein n=1 Tax=Scheffersomyces amazonensis TaxID=1078765 RepID=UPI00315D2C11
MSQPQVKKEVSVKKEGEGNNLNDVVASKGTSKSSTPSSSTDEGWQEIPLKSCNQQELDDIRFHIMKFQTKQDVRIVENFTKPVRLHRKDPRNIQFHLTREEMEIRKREQEEAKREKERERDNIDDEDGDLEIGDKDGEGSSSKIINPEDETKRDYRKINPEMAQVAPDGGARKNKKNLFKRKTKQVNLMDDAKRKLRYEEFYPWVVEDYDGKNVFVGNYEGGSSETTQVLFVFDKDGFKVVPAEKVYRFTPRNKYATLTLEEAESKMERRSHVPRWLMKHMEEGQSDYRFRRNQFGEGRSVPASNFNRGLRTVIGGDGSYNDRDSDHDDLDFDEEFADDEEAPIMDGDEEENKLSEQRVKKEMLKAAHFDGPGGESEDDEIDDLFETEKSRKVDKEGKKLRKVLNKREGGVYDSDDEDDNSNPYLSKSDLESDDSDDEDVVKDEETEDNQGLQDSAKNIPRSIFAYNFGDGFIVIKAPSEFLNGFPKGEWVPNGRKRLSSGLEESPTKKLKTEDSSSTQLRRDASRDSTSPQPEASIGDLNSAGPDGSLVTIQEVLDIVRGNPLTTKELLSHLKSKVSAHPDNKTRIISIVKQNLKLQDRKLVLREQ